MNGKPLSVIISDDIRDRIKQGILKHNDLLPSENELCQRYGVSRVTVQKAFDILSNEYLIRSVPDAAPPSSRGWVTGSDDLVSKTEDAKHAVTILISVTA